MRVGLHSKPTASWDQLDCVLQTGFLVSNFSACVSLNQNHFDLRETNSGEIGNKFDQNSYKLIIRKHFLEHTIG